MLCSTCNLIKGDTPTLSSLMQKSTATTSPKLALYSPPVLPTASHANRRREGRNTTARKGSEGGIHSTTPFETTSRQQHPSILNSELLSPTHQAAYPLTQFSPNNALGGDTKASSSLKQAFHPPPPASPKQTFKPSPFPTRPRRPSSSRLWNPTNSTPRLVPGAFTSPPPLTSRDLPPTPVLLSHPQLSPSHNNRQTERPDSYPLLTLPEQHAKRNSHSESKNLQVELSGLPSPRISLPRSVSIELSRKTPTSNISHSTPSDSPESQKQKVTGFRKRGQSISNTTEGAPEVRDFAVAATRIDYKGKGKEVDRGYNTQGRSLTMENIAPTLSANSADKDLESGGRSHSFQPNLRNSGFPNINANASATSLSATSGIGPALNSPALTNTNSSVVGSDHGENPGATAAWGPNHPCYPHLNPHVPINSPLYQSTRIIRIRRDWLMEGDLAPTFSNMYPEILEPAGLSEQEFRRVISKVNEELVPAFSPFGWRNMFDSVMGLLTGWVWDDLGATGIKRRLQNVENWLEEWNRRMEKGMGEAEAVRIVPLRRTGYMNLDIQIPDPVFTEVPDDQSEVEEPAQED